VNDHEEAAHETAKTYEEAALNALFHDHEEAAHTAAHIIFKSYYL
jgi:hypothetical protein